MHIHDIPVELLTECIVLSGSIATFRICKLWHDVVGDVANLTRLLVVHHGSADDVAHKCCDFVDGGDTVRHETGDKKTLVLRRLFVEGPDLPTGQLLVRAVTRANFPVVEELLSWSPFPSSHTHTFPAEKITDPNYGQGAAMNVAVVRGSAKMVALLIAAGAHADARGGAFLVSACKDGHLDIAKMLLAAPHHAVRGDVRDGEALAVAVAYGHVDVVEHLFSLPEDGGRPRADCQEGRALMIAVANGREEIARMLLSNGATADTRNCLSLAVKRRRADMVELLLAQPDDPAHADMENHELLWLAVLNDDVAVAEKLLKKRPHAARADCRDGAVFLMAVGNGQLQMVELLLGQVEHAARADTNGSKALLLAVRKGDIAMARLLLSQEKNSARADADGSAAVAIALGLPADVNKDMLRLLLEQREHPATADEGAFMFALKTGDEELVDVLEKSRAC